MAAKAWLLVFIVALAACVPPGKGRKARAQYKEAQPLLDAIEAYHQKNQRYPDEPNQLVPDYLPYLSNTFFYKKTEDGFSLFFSYTGPGMNQCTYQPKTKWLCHGYF